MHSVARSISAKPWFKGVTYGLAFAAVCTVFMLTLPFRNVYALNQQHHFLHGLADAGYGYLANDWYVATPDPFPLYSLLVSFTYTCLHMDLFYVYHAVFLGLFAFSLAGIVLRGLEQEFSAFRVFLLVSAVILVFSAPLGIGIWHVLGGQLKPFLRMWHGFADHYLIRRNFEPATIGVLLLVASWLFLRGNRYAGMVVCGVATAVDPVYVPHFALLTVSCLLLAWRSGASMRELVLLALTALVCVMPAVIHVLLRFGSSSPDIAARAAWISVHLRAPHHRLISLWFDGTSVFQLAIGFIALLLHWRKPYGMILAPLYAALLFVLGAQAVLQHDRIAMLMPWRLSVLTTPLSVMGIVGWGIDKGLRWVDAHRRNLRPYITGVILLLMLVWIRSGLIYRKEYFAPFLSVASQQLREYVREHKEPGDLYIMPFCTDDQYASFHMTTGAPLYVSGKVMPHSPEGTLEWHRRVQVQNALFQMRGTPFSVKRHMVYWTPGPGAMRCRSPRFIDYLTELPVPNRNTIQKISSEEHVTHIGVFTFDRIRFDSIQTLRPVYEDSVYVLYNIVGSDSADYSGQSWQRAVSSSGTDE